MDDIAHNLHALTDDIAAVCSRIGRDPAEVRLIAVSKTKPANAILSALAAGQRAFGENYAQEFRDKARDLADQPIEWHFIGHLQSNKAKHVVGRAALIHTLDRLSLAREIERLAAARDVRQDCLIEVRLAAEATKSGCPIAEVRDLVRALKSFPHIRVRGLMTIGSLTEDRARTRAEFAALRNLRDALRDEGLADETGAELSMGMSGDWDIAVEEGATLVRVGARIFGARASRP